MEHARLARIVLSVPLLGATSVSPLDLQHGDFQPLTNVAEHVLVMPTMNYHCPPSGHNVWSDNVSRGRQCW